MHCLLRSLLLSLFLASPAWAAAPSRTHTYTTGETIDPSKVTTNEDNVFSYLQAGVDTYAAGSVNAAAIADNAVGSSEIAAGAVDAGDMATTGTIADDKVFIADSSTAGTWRTITNCTASTEALRYTQSPNAGACGTISADVGGTNAGRVSRTAGNVTTTSTTFVDFTGATLTFTTAANPILMGFIGACQINDAAANLRMNFDIDGTLVLAADGVPLAQAIINERQLCSVTVLSAAQTAASHTVKFQWLTSVGTASIECDSTQACVFWAMEAVD